MRNSEATQRDLNDTARELRLLQVPADIWERYGHTCIGCCQEPTTLATTADGHYAVTCCEFWLSHQFLLTTKNSQHLLRDKLASELRQERRTDSIT